MFSYGNDIIDYQSELDLITRLDKINNESERLFNLVIYNRYMSLETSEGISFVNMCFLDDNKAKREFEMSPCGFIIKLIKGIFGLIGSFFKALFGFSSKKKDSCGELKVVLKKEHTKRDKLISLAKKAKDKVTGAVEVENCSDPKLISDITKSAEKLVNGTNRNSVIAELNKIGREFIDSFKGNTINESTITKILSKIKDEKKYQRLKKNQLKVLSGKLTNSSNASFKMNFKNMALAKESTDLDFILRGVQTIEGQLNSIQSVSKEIRSKCDLLEKQAEKFSDSKEENARFKKAKEASQLILKAFTNKTNEIMAEYNFFKLLLRKKSILTLRLTQALSKVK